jgi:endonuclease/exonuclease/phosphatase family metal-dependent hydrolase
MNRIPLLTGALAAAATLSGACAPATNLLSANQPQFLGQYAPAPVTVPAAAPAAAPLRVVTFNIKESQEIDGAIAVLQGDSLRGADVVMLQEMNESGVDRIARELRLNYAYYPAVIHHRTGDYYGPAVLSRWPIERSWKVMLPYGSWDRGMRRTATAAVLRANGLHVLVYAVHLETMVKLSPEKRAEQVRAVTDDAKRFSGPVVIAGDFNDYAMAACMHREGFRWLTEWVGPTHTIFPMDHILTRGLAPVEPGGVGVVHEVHGASDHHPVWAVLTPAPAAPSLAGSSRP